LSKPPFLLAKIQGILYVMNWDFMVKAFTKQFSRKNVNATEQ